MCKFARKSEGLATGEEDKRWNKEERDDEENEANARKRRMFRARETSDARFALPDFLSPSRDP